jgi:hypothetical protein
VIQNNFSEIFYAASNGISIKKFAGRIFPLNKLSGESCGMKNVKSSSGCGGWLEGDVRASKYICLFCL